MQKIVIDFIPHKRQRYDTCGDYFVRKGIINIRVSKMNDTHEFLVMMHELTEWFLATKKGVKIKDIDDFDTHFKGEGEPGDDPESPYYTEHQIATTIERQLAGYLGVDWNKYSEYIDNL